VMSPVVERLVAAGHRVVACGEGDGVEELVAAGLGVRPTAVATLCTALPLNEVEAEAWEPLRAALAGLVKAHGKFKVREVAVGRLGYPGSPVAGRAAITQAKLGELTAVTEIGELASGWLASGRALVLSADHPTLQHLRTVARSEPELAAYLALKSFFLHGELKAELDAELASAAAEARWRRTGN
jgi:hypothetical protein